MGIFNKKATITNTVKSFIEKVWTRAPTRDKSELPDLAQKSPRLDPIGLIARSVASTELLIYNRVDLRGGKEKAEPIIDHPLYDLLDTPIRRYPEIDGYAMIYLTNAIVDLVGEFYWMKIRSDSGQVIELDPVPPAWVTMTPTRSNPYYLVYPYGVSAGKAFPVRPEDMVFFKRPDLNDPYGRGRGAAESILDELETDENLAKMQKNFAYNDGTPPFLLSVPGLPKDQAEALKSSWMEKFGGWMHRREPAIVGFDAKVTPLAINPVEMDMIASRKFLRDEALQHYQIPPEIYGIIENSNRSTIDSAFYLYNKNVLNDRYRFLERAITRQLVRPDFDDALCIKFNEKVPEDEAFKLQVLNAGIAQGIITPNEWRSNFGFDPLPANRGDVLRLSMATYDVPLKSIAAPEKPQETLPTEEEAKNIIAVKILDAEDEAAIKKTVVRIVDSDAEESRKEAIWKSFDARARAHEKEFIEAIKRFSETQKKRVVEALNTKKVNDTLRTGTAVGIEIDHALDTVFDVNSDKALKSALAPAWLSTMQAGREHAHEIIGKSVEKDIGPDWDLFNKLANEWIEKFGLIKAQEINTTTYTALQQKIRDAIDSAREDNGTLRDVKNAILDACDGEYENMDNARAMMISRTETATAENFGNLTTAKGEGMQKKVWLASKDSRTRGSDAHDEFDHIHADGETVGIDEPFMATGEPLQYPGDPEGSAGNVINCRCALYYVD